MTTAAHEMTLHGDLPCLTYGDGPPLVYIRTVTPEAGNPTGVSRWAETRLLTPLAPHRTIYTVGHRPDLRPGTTMADLASHLAEGVGHQFSGPVDIMGVSTGGSIALQFAADHPDLVRRLVACATACRLGPLGQQVQRRYAELLAARRYRAANVALAPALTPSPAGRLAMKALLWLSAPTRPEDPDSMVAMLGAEDSFDLSSRCGDICAPTLIIAGERDLLYPRELAEHAVAAIPHAHLHVYQGCNHQAVTRAPHFYPDLINFLTSADG